MKNNLNKNSEVSNKKFKETLKSLNQNILYKSYNNKKNKIKINNNNQELSDIKSIVKNSVEKIYDLFNLQEMKENSKTKKSNKMKSTKNIFNEDNSNNIKTIDKNDDNRKSPKDNKKNMKNNLTFKMSNYLTVLDKNKNIKSGVNNGKSNLLNYENSYLQKKYKKNKTQKNSTHDINSTINIKKNKKNELKKNNINNYNYIKNKRNIKNNILKGMKGKKLNNNIISNNNINNINYNEYYYLSSNKKISNNENNKDNYKDKMNDNNYYINEKNNSNKMEESNYVGEKSIIVNTRYKNNDTNRNNYIIKAMKISHINKDTDITLTNECNQSKDTKIILDSKNKSYNTSEKRKKYIFLKRAKSKNEFDSEAKKKKRKIFSQKNSGIKYKLTNSRISNYNDYKFFNTGEEFYLRNKNKFIDKISNNNDENNINNDDQYNYNINNFDQNSNSKINKIDNENEETDIYYKNDSELNTINQDKYIQTTNKLVNINNLLISGINSPHYLSKKCKSDNKLKISKNKNKKNNKISTNLLIIGSDNKNKNISRNSIGMGKPIRMNKDNKILNIIEKKILYNSSNKKNSERINIRKTLKKIYDKEFPNKASTNDLIKLFLLLNEYIISNNLLTDYNLNDNKNILNKLSEFLSNYSYIDYPKEIDINIDKYINKVKKIQRTWRKYKIKKLLGKNEETHELKKILVNRFITKAGYKMKKIIGLFNSMMEDFNNIKNNEDINRMFYYLQNLIKRELTSYEKNIIYKEFINNFLYLK